MIPLSQLGQKISIIGCSNSGKSTLAVALARKLTMPVYHLDQYAHIPNTNWQLQSPTIFMSQHEQILQRSQWIIEGNYRICLAQRLDKASAVIWLDANVYCAAWRYLKRSLRHDPQRPGRLTNAKREFNLRLLKWILINYPKNRLHYQQLLMQRPQLLVLKINSLTALKNYYNFWQLGV